MRRHEGEYEVGEFEVTGGRLVVSDPCYSPGTWCAGVLDKVKNGTWESWVVVSDEGSWGSRVASLNARLKGTHDEPWRRASFTVGVDAGQVCIVDEKHFRGGDGEYDDRGSFYGDACDKSMNDLGAGILKSGHGVNSSSGFGDGSYTCYYGSDKDGNITSVRVVFIEEAVTCENCDAEAGADGWDENDMVDGQCPICRGRSFCEQCNQWLREKDMEEDSLCKQCAPEDDEEEERDAV